ncbi:acyl-CoA N-acyltransferase [Xylaria castorea]|nr:acyl-CoA N-acyltransferase [Xylaria castorea]
MLLSSKRCRPTRSVVDEKDVTIPRVYSSLLWCNEFEGDPLEPGTPPTDSSASGSSVYCLNAGGSSPSDQVKDVREVPMHNTERASAQVSRPISMEDVADCYQLSQSVSWSLRIEDWDFCIRLGQGIEISENNRAIAAGLWWPYGAGYATMGLIMVAPNRQGNGIGKRLMAQLLEQTGSRTRFLNSTAEELPLYTRLGFIKIGYVRSYRGKSFNIPTPVLGEGQKLRPATQDDWQVLFELDIQATGFPRRHILESLFERGETIVLEQAGKVLGFSILYRLGRGMVIGPVIAPGTREACFLIQNWMHSHWIYSEAGYPLKTTLPAGTGLDNWLIDHGFLLKVSTTGMVEGIKPTMTGPSRQYAVIGQAFF